MNPYQYCSRCGEELPNGLKEKYLEQHQSGPVLCRSCVVEVFQDIPKAIQSVLEAFGNAFEEVFGSGDNRKE